MESLQSQLLVALPELAEPFTRSVVLLVRHNEQGALGLILNRRTSATLKETWDRLSQIPCERDDSLYLGGPCEGPLLALHTRDALPEFEVMPGLYFCAGKENLERLVAEDGDDPVKFFAGYAGWSAGQLENEIARGSWSILPGSIEDVFGQDDDLWVRATRKVSGEALREALHIKQSPPDPSLN